MWTTNLIKVILSETEKRVLVIAFLVLLLIVLFVGLLTKLVKNASKKNGQRIDREVNGYVKYRFVKTPREFKRIGFKKNQELLLKEFFFPFLILLVAFVMMTIVCNVQKISFNYIWPIYNDMTLKIDFKWDFLFNFIPYPTEWPHINENSFTFYGTFEAIIAYAFLILFIIGCLGLIIATNNYIAREKRIKEKAKVLFVDNLDSLENPVTSNNNTNNN